MIEKMTGIIKNYPDVFQKLWEDYVLPALTEKLGEKPKTQIVFYCEPEGNNFRGNILIRKFAEFINEIFDIATERATIANDENKKLKERNEFLQKYIDEKLDETNIGSAVTTIIKMFKGEK
jgi:hypothetical protein